MRGWYIMNGKDEFGLLPKQRLFADLYLGGMFATAALRQAGYRDIDTAKGAHRMLQRKEVRAYVKLQRERLAERTGIDREKVVMWLWRVIWTPIARAGEEERELLEWEHFLNYKDGRTSRRVRMVNKMAAVRQLCTMMGWNEPEREAASEGGESGELTEMIRKARAQGWEKMQGRKVKDRRGEV